MKPVADEMDLLRAVGRHRLRFGFMDMPAEQYASELFKWRTEITPGEVVERKLRGGARDLLSELGPANSEQRRDVVIGTDSSWTALFDSAQRSDPTSALAHIGRTTGARWILVSIAPFRRSSASEEELGAIQFWYCPDPAGEPRTLALVEDSVGARYHFEAGGPVQPFEDVEAYTSRLKRDRFTFSMLSDYCKALGIDVFNPDFYSGPGYVVERSIPRSRPKYFWSR